MLRPADNELSGRQAPAWTARPERSNALAMKTITWVALAMGRPLARLLLYPICLYFIAFSAFARAASRDYLRRALGRDAALLDSFRHYHAFASVTLDRLYLLKGEIDRFDVRVQGADIIQRVIANGQGCVLLGAHVGSFEVVRAVGRARGFKVNMVMYEDNARKTGEIFESIAPELKSEIIGLGNVDSILKVEAALARGEIVGLLADRSIQGGGTVSCEFLGASARFPAGPIRIAAMLNRPVVLMFGLYLGGNRYEVCFEQLCAAEDLAGPAREPLIRSLLQRYAGRLEHYCRLAPYNWFNFYEFWD
jgi:predicted LPLAT superfamily acyltransferase